MTCEEAIQASNYYNDEGRYNAEWYYYPTYHRSGNTWFVMRRLKDARVEVAVFIDGTVSEREK